VGDGDLITATESESCLVVGWSRRMGTMSWPHSMARPLALAGLNGHAWRR
jgi:hypothetical protein